MASSNDITGDTIQSRASTDLYRDNWERIFGKKRTEKSEPKDDSSQ